MAVKKAKLEAFKCKCERCGHEWVSTSVETKPLRCAGCKTPYWNIPPKSEQKQANG